MNDNRRVSRRSVAAGGGVAVAIGLAAMGIEVPRLLERHYRKTAYDDLLAQLPDRDAAAVLGRELKPANFNAKAIARELRQKLQFQTLQQLVAADADSHRLVEIKGWILPSSLGQLAMLAAAEN